MLRRNAGPDRDLPSHVGMFASRPTSPRPPPPN